MNIPPAGHWDSRLAEARVELLAMAYGDAYRFTWDHLILLEKSGARHKAKTGNLEASTALTGHSWRPVMTLPTGAEKSSRILDCSDWPRTHYELAHWNHARLKPTVPHADWRQDLISEARMKRLEGDWIETLRTQIAPLVANVPQNVDEFTDWFKALEATGPGQHDPLFDWLADEATVDEMNWFLTQEAAGEAGFDDLVALAQLKVPVAKAKLELARNYWDEMGRGNEAGMHGPMLEGTVRALGLTPTIDSTVWESLALANTLTAFATTRRYAWHAIGALGVVELTAPGRVAKIAEGLKRLGHPPVVRKYFQLHAVLDIRHAEDWIASVLRPLVIYDPSIARWLAEGALMRLTCGARCFETYRAELWSSQRRMAAE